MRTRLSLFVLIGIFVSLAPAVPAGPPTQGLQYSTPEQLLADATTGPCKNEERLAAVRELFVRCGAKETDIQIVEAGKVKNLVVTMRGSDAGTVVVGAHYDKVSAGCGAIDNWTGVTLMAHIYRTLRPLRPKRTYMFVAFGDEEIGLKGSKAMVDAIPKADRASYCAMVNFDSFGLARAQVLNNVSTLKLTEFVRKVAEGAEIPFATASVTGAGADSESFKLANIPAVTIHGLSKDWDKIIHTKSDSASSIDAGSLMAGYALGLNVVAQLDSCDCAQFR